MVIRELLRLGYCGWSGQNSKGRKQPKGETKKDEPRTAADLEPELMRSDAIHKNPVQLASYRNQIEIAPKTKAQSLFPVHTVIYQPLRK